MKPVSQNFIPFQSSDLVQMCLTDEFFDDQDTDAFSKLSVLLKKLFHSEFYSVLENLSAAYESVNPDSDKVVVDCGQSVTSKNFKPLLEDVLNKANFRVLSRSQIERAMQESSLFKIRLHVDFDEFEELMVFYRGASERRETLPFLFGLYKKKVQFVNYERIALYVRYKDAAGHQKSKTNTEPKTILKLFRNVPKSDVEMLFPNTKVGMRIQDKLLIGVPAIIGGGIVLTTKLGATLVLLGGLFGFWFGIHKEPVALDSTALLALCAGVGAVAGYLWKQFSNFKNRKLRFAQALTQNLYFKSLDNNAGVFHRLVGEAEDEEFKESLLAYYFLLQYNGLEKKELDPKIEIWFAQRWGVKVDFDVDDALHKLERLQLVTQTDNFWYARPLGEAIEIVRNRIVTAL